MMYLAAISSLYPFSPDTPEMLSICSSAITVMSVLDTAVIARPCLLALELGVLVENVTS